MKACPHNLPTQPQSVPEELLEKARSLRKNQTNNEQLLWKLIRNRQFQGVKFRRQHPIPPYILDFYAHDLQLAIEIDGGHHSTNNYMTPNARLI